MGSSFIKYKEFGFWSRDSFIESWLTTLIAEMEKEVTQEQWQQALMAHWRIQAEFGGVGCISLGLDEFLTDKSREEFVLSLAKRALESSEPLGRETGELFINLLEGRLQTNASSPIDYLHWPHEH